VFFLHIENGDFSILMKDMWFLQVKIFIDWSWSKIFINRSWSPKQGLTMRVILKSTYSFT
jgi:hypothetical protein